MLKKLKNLLKAEPAAVFVTALGTVVSLVVAFGHLDGTKSGYVSAIGTGVGTVVTAFLARPVNVAVISGAAATVLQALVLFNLRLSSAEVAAVVGGVNLVLGYLVMRPALTPVVKAKAVARPSPVTPITAARRPAA